MKQRKTLFYNANDPKGFDIDKAKSICESKYRTEGYFSTNILKIPRNTIIPILNDIEKSMMRVVTDKTFVIKTHSDYVKSKTNRDSCDDELLYIDTDRIKKLFLYYRNFNSIRIVDIKFPKGPFLNIYLEGRDPPIKLCGSFEIEEFKKFLNKISRYDLLLSIS